MRPNTGEGAAGKMSLMSLSDCRRLAADRSLDTWAMDVLRSVLGGDLGEPLPIQIRVGGTDKNSLQ